MNKIQLFGLQQLMKLRFRNAGKILLLVVVLFIFSFPVSKVESINLHKTAQTTPPKKSENEKNTKSESDNKSESKSEREFRLFLEKNNFNMEEYFNYNFGLVYPNETDKKIIEKGELVNFLKNSKQVGIYYRPIITTVEYPYYQLFEHVNFLIVTQHIQNNTGERYNLYRLAKFPKLKEYYKKNSLSLKLFDEYVKNFKPILENENLPPVNQLVHVDRDVMGFLKMLNCQTEAPCNDYELMAFDKNRESHEINYKVKLDGKISKIKYYNNYKFLLAEMQNLDTATDSLAVYNLEKNKIEPIEILPKIIGGRKIAYFEYEQYLNIAIEDVVYINVYHDNAQDSEGSYICPSQIIEDIYIFNCQPVRRELFYLPYLEKKYGKFLTNSYLISTNNDVPVTLDPTFKKADFALVKFTGRLQSSELSKGDNLTLFHSYSNKTYQSIFEKLNKTEIASQLEEGEHISGLTKVVEYDKYQKDARDVRVAFRNDVLADLKRGVIERIPLTAAWKNEIKSFANKQLRFDESVKYIYSVQMEDFKILIFPYHYFEERDSDMNDPFETLFFKLKDNQLSLLYKMQGYVEPIFCLKSENSDVWNLLYEETHKYYGTSAWGEFNKQSLKSYYPVAGWMD